MIVTKQYYRNNFWDSAFVIVANLSFSTNILERFCYISPASHVLTQCFHTVQPVPEATQAFLDGKESATMSGMSSPSTTLVGTRRTRVPASWLPAVNVDVMQTEKDAALFG